MEILTVKETRDINNNLIGYLVNDTMQIPNAEGNRHYQIVKEWITNGGVVEPFETEAEAAARLIAEENAAAKAELVQIDIESVRSIREWITSQPNAPQFLIDKENAAQAARARIK